MKEISKTHHTESKAMEEVKKQEKFFLKIIIVLAVANTILFPIVIKGGRGPAGNFQAILISNLVGFNILGFLIGALVALIPYKGLSYKQKYLRSSLLTILIIQAIMSAIIILLIILTVIGWFR